MVENPHCEALAALQVVDEPLYASYLAATGAERPYRDQARGWDLGSVYYVGHVDGVME